MQGPRGTRRTRPMTRGPARRRPVRTRPAKAGRGIWQRQRNIKRMNDFPHTAALILSRVPLPPLPMGAANNSLTWADRTTPLRRAQESLECTGMKMNEGPVFLSQLSRRCRHGPTKHCALDLSPILDSRRPGLPGGLETRCTRASAVTKIYSPIPGASNTICPGNGHRMS